MMTQTHSKNRNKNNIINNINISSIINYSINLLIQYIIIIQTILKASSTPPSSTLTQTLPLHILQNQPTLTHSDTPPPHGALLPSLQPFNPWGLEHPSYAEVEIVLGNDGFSAYQPDVYGAEIRMVRRITDGGSSTFALKNSQGESTGGTSNLEP